MKETKTRNRKGLILLAQVVVLGGLAMLAQSVWFMLGAMVAAALPWLVLSARQTVDATLRQPLCAKLTGPSRHHSHHQIKHISPANGLNRW
ncbi:hypothetical protein [Vibrio furnissii]|uniref:hypothetical protein n=1 Tax=Vibrio furnissii TaxID=29494 RepID=UPI001F54DE63|nr:hypothetical protein [Vibrio furnissii]